MQLTPMWIEVTALHTRAVEVDALVAQMAQVEARRSELEDKVLEIEEKEDNHIAYLEAQLENLSLLGEEKKVDDESEGKGGEGLEGTWTRKPAIGNAPSHSCDAIDQPASRYSRFNGLHGKETPRIFDVSRGGSMEYAGTGARR